MIINNKRKGQLISSDFISAPATPCDYTSLRDGQHRLRIRIRRERKKYRRGTCSIVCVCCCVCVQRHTSRVSLIIPHPLYIVSTRHQQLVIVVGCLAVKMSSNNYKGSSFIHFSTPGPFALRLIWWSYASKCKRVGLMCSWPALLLTRGCIATNLKLNRADIWNPISV